MANPTASPVGPKGSDIGAVMSWIDYGEIRVRVRLIELLAAIGWRATRERGAQLRGPCPLPGCRGSRCVSTFSLHCGRNIYRCFRCGSQGSVIDFWSAYCEQPLVAAAQELATKEPTILRADHHNK
jgi:hypothetical protein